MKKIIALLITTACFTAAAASSIQKKEPVAQAAAANLTEVKVCPITGTPVEGKGSGSAVVGKYKVYFCCKGCVDAFAELSPEEKEKKIMAALAKQQETKKKS